MAATRARGQDASLIDEAAGPNEPGPHISEADDDAGLPRLLMLELEHPFDTYETNTAFWYSISEAFGKANDALGAHVGMDSSPWGRACLLVCSFWAANVPWHYAHEVAHEIPFRAHGVTGDSHLDWSDWSHFGLPRFDQGEGENTGIFSSVEWIRVLTGGLNQNEMLARTTWAVTMRRGRMDLQGRFDYLWGKLADVEYLAEVGLGDPDGTGDIDRWLAYINIRDLLLTKEQYLGQILLADLVSWHTWESASHILTYARTGRRFAAPFVWTTPGGTAVAPPIVSCFMTRYGIFYDVVTMLNPQGRYPIEVSVGFGESVLGAGEEETLRVGGRLSGLRWKTLSFEPRLYVDVTSDGIDGASVGVAMRIHGGGDFAMHLTMEHNEMDVLENRIKGEDDGPKLSAGIEWRY